ncbi:MAG: efflux RND transporter periplasmic adaptor subunit [Pseudomonadota bacterium]
MSVALLCGVLIGYVASSANLVSSLLPAGSSSQQPATATGPAASPHDDFPSNAIFVTVATVRESAPRSRLEAIGTGKAAQSVEVTSDFGGTIEKMHVRPNTLVSAGEPIVTFERRTQRILLDSANAELEQKTSAFDRLNVLVSQNSTAVSQAQLDEARAALAVASAQVAEAEYEYDRRVVRAPFSGEINLSDLTVGSYVAQGSEIVTLVDTTSLVVEFSVPESAVSQIAVGVDVRLTTPALRGRVFTGKITAFDSSIDAELRTVRVRAEVRNPDNALVHGMTFSVNLSRAETPLPVVPSVSILWDRQGAYVWRLDENDAPEQIAVVLRQRLRDDVWVEADLSDGDRVVKDGAFKVSQGVVLAIEVSGTQQSQGNG